MSTKIAVSALAVQVEFEDGSELVIDRADPPPAPEARVERVLMDPKLRDNVESYARANDHQPWAQQLQNIVDLALGRKPSFPNWDKAAAAKRRAAKARSKPHKTKK